MNNVHLKEEDDKRMNEYMNQDREFQKWGKKKKKRQRMKGGNKVLSHRRV